VFGESDDGNGAQELVKECTSYGTVVDGTVEGLSCTVWSSVLSRGQRELAGWILLMPITCLDKFKPEFRHIKGSLDITTDADFKTSTQHCAGHTLSLTATVLFFPNMKNLFLLIHSYVKLTFTKFLQAKCSIHGIYMKCVLAQ